MDQGPRVWQRIAVPASFALMFLVSYLSPFDGDIGTISRKSDTLLTPSGPAFAIWGLIYLLQLGYVIYVAIPNHIPESKNRRLVADTVIPVLGATFWQTAWMLAFLSDSLVGFWLCAVFLPTVAVFLGVVFFKLLDVRTWRQEMNGWEVVLVGVFFSVYFGWVCAASAIAIVQPFVRSGALDSGNVLVAAVVLVLVLVFFAVLAYKQHNVIFGAVFVWTSIFIATKNTGLTPVAWTCSAIMVVIEVLVLWRLKDEGSHDKFFRLAG
mmetsp:Transcript_52777/g.113109  ORF Transcript_52777/g.113109 Transcript_52777/m.113109 type:complete len:266 (+) Transcript_52777:39-836(+)